MKTLYIAFLLGLVRLSVQGDEFKPLVETALRKLEAKPFYSWKTSFDYTGISGAAPGTFEGKSERNGFSTYQFTLKEQPIAGVFKERKHLVKLREEWLTLDEIEAGNQAYLAVYLGKAKAPAMELQDLLKTASNFSEPRTGDYKAELDAEFATQRLHEFLSLLGFKPEEQEQSSSVVEFSLRDGLLKKYETTVESRVKLFNVYFPMKLVTTVELGEGSAVEIPEAIKTKLMP